MSDLSKDSTVFPADWVHCKVSDLIKQGVIDKPLDGNHGEIHPSGDDFVDDGIPFVMATDITNGKIDFANCKFITEEQSQKLRKGFAKEGDVLLTHKASLGRTALVKPTKYPYLVLTPQVTYYRVIDSHKLSNRFLRYFFDSPYFQETLQNHGDAGSTRAYVGITAQQELPIAFPESINEQSSLAAVFCSLDDKIDLLHRQNKTLEAMAETLFRQWFIEEARERVPITDYVEFNPTRRLSKGVLAPYLDMAGVSTSTFNPSDWYDREFSSGTKFINGDTLLARITPCLENGKSAFVTFLQSGQVGWGSTEFIVMRTRQPLATFFTYALARNQAFRDYAEGCMAGSSGRQRVDVEHLKQFEIGKVSSTIVSEFNNLIEPIPPKLHENMLQIRTLEKLRDTLLPKLMSGELRVQYE